jgi:hypothetical protein
VQIFVRDHVQAVDRATLATAGLSALRVMGGIGLVAAGFVLYSLGIIVVNEIVIAEAGVSPQTNPEFFSMLTFSFTAPVLLTLGAAAQSAVNMVSDADVSVIETGALVVGVYTVGWFGLPAFGINVPMLGVF